MKKFIITEEERHQILNLYKEKRLIIEQSSKVAYNHETTSDSDKGFNYFTTNERAKANINYVGSKYYNETLVNRKLVDSKIPKEDSSSISIWETIYQNDKVFAANTIEYTKKNEWIEVISFRDKIESEEDKGKPSNELNDGVTVEIADDALTNNYFEDNLSVLTDEGKRDLTTQIIQPLVAGKGDRDGCIDLIEIHSSASRYRNTESAKDKSFLQLSTERNNAVKTYLLQQLNANGFNKWCKGSENIIQNPKGSLVNGGDGTSGPNPPIGTPFILKGQEKMEPPAKDETKRNQCGEPHPRPEDYDKYKYSKPKVRVGFNNVTPGAPDVVPAVPNPNVTKRYVAEFKGNVGIYTPNEKDKKGGGSNTGAGKTNRNEVKNVMVSCPVFRINKDVGLQ
jgi:hypothetical protein